MNLEVASKKCTRCLCFTQLLSNGRQVEKEGKTKIQKFEYLESEKRFSDETKSIFQNYLRAIVW